MSTTTEIEETTAKKKRSPDVYKRFLEETLEKVASSVSHERFHDIFRPLTSNTWETYECFQQGIVKSMHNVIDSLSKKGSIDEKIDKLKGILKEDLIVCDGEAWRPTTGQIDVLSIEGHALEARKAKLLEAINNLEEDNEKILCVINEKKQLLEKRDDDLKYLRQH
ncbi:uncharacterized protein [Onthophagus taurus]|uniref:uncharacterized protein n=1 Tax=Onthophagus taurus TaxID=166361 RepID=UPI0039BE2685